MQTARGTLTKEEPTAAMPPDTNATPEEGRSVRVDSRLQAAP
jgi:hypothetical protein